MEEGNVVYGSEVDNVVELGRIREVAEIVSRLTTGEGRVKVEGTWGSFARLLGAHLADELGRPILYVCGHPEDADKAADDLRTFGAKNGKTLASWAGEQEWSDATDEIGAERLRLVSYLGDFNSEKLEEQLVITAGVQGLCQAVPEPAELQQQALKLNRGKEYSPEVVVSWLVDNGFERVERVDLPGQYARRGGIVDIYGPLITYKSTTQGTEKASDIDRSHEQEGGGSEAVRIEFWGDVIESLREIDLDTQRSRKELEQASIVGLKASIAEGTKEQFLNILPPETVVILEEPNNIQEVAEVYWQRTEDHEKLYGWKEIFDALKSFSQVYICRFGKGDDDDFLKLNIQSIQQYQHTASATWSGHKKCLEELVGTAQKGNKVLFYCERAAEVKRVGEIIEHDGGKVPGNLKILTGYVDQGFIIEALRTIVVTHHELFGQFALRRRGRALRTGVPVESLAELEAGDYVVHASYGIGRFLGIQTIAGREGKSEYLSIEYANGVKIQVSAKNIGLVQKYIGTSPKRPKLSKVGSKRWKRQKEKVARAVESLAAEMLSIQARRNLMDGISFGEDSQWQAEFEESFAYVETADQVKAAEAIKKDMQYERAMDRLLCGDVGYGKTELAMRAAFKAVEGGRQVAVLVPTTVLSVQHERTFLERFADFPVSVEVLNRFKNTREVRDIIKRSREGKVDILIGTHRLLSGDVRFKDLGLLIIDEEQRFGVEHKERLKKLRVNVNILTMTATPIPRTLHMSLLGLRDISSLATPPLDRRSIVTTVTGYNDELIRRGILRELNRRGQVFFVHNRVRSIDKKAWELQKLVTDAKVGVAHGRMSKRQLEKVMVDFVVGDIDVLVCTTIIESGLDIPNANTMFINNADRFGLAELHQLRGRVGRYKHRAFAYMLLPRSRPVTPVATKRLKAIETYSHLGAGFRIALRDLEIRGAGNILGAEQSGHIQTVGYQMYCELLSKAVRRMKNEPVEALPTTVIDLGLATYIPRSYIAPDRERMEAYRKISTARTTEDLEQTRDELEDIYGAIPREMEMLLAQGELRVRASKRGIRSIVASGRDLIFSFADGHDFKNENVFSQAHATVRFGGQGTVYVRFKQSCFDPPTLVRVLRKMLSK